MAAVHSPRSPAREAGGTAPSASAPSVTDSPRPSCSSSGVPSAGQRTHQRNRSFTSLPRSGSGYSLAALPPANIPPPPSPPSAGPRHGTIIPRAPKSFDPATRPAPTYHLKGRAAGPVGKWVFIVNGAKRAQWEQLAPRITKQLSNAEFKVRITRRKGHAVKLAETAARGGANLIAAVGGDGTLNEVVDGVMRARVLGADGLPLAVITVLPLGSASDFHRSMGWDPHDFERAMWRMGHEGSVATLDVGRIECDSPDGPVARHFINVASCGVSAKAALGVAKWRWLGAKLAYRMAALSALFCYRARPLGVSLDGGEWQRLPRGTMVAVGNGSYFGNGINIAPDADPYDGRLQVVCANGLGVWDFLFNSWRLRMGTHLTLKGFTVAEAARVDVVEWRNKKRAPVAPVFRSRATAWRTVAEIPGRPPPEGDESRSPSFSQPSGSSAEAAMAAAGAAAVPESTGSSPDRAGPGTPDAVSPSWGSASSRVESRRDAGTNGSSVPRPPACHEQAFPAGTPASKPPLRASPAAALRSTVSISPAEERRAPQRALSTASSDDDSGVSFTSLNTISSWDQRRPRRPKESKEQRERKERVMDYGPVPVEVDGEVIGHVPFTITVLPHALKFKV